MTTTYKPWVMFEDQVMPPEVVGKVGQIQKRNTTRITAEASSVVALDSIDWTVARNLDDAITDFRIRETVETTTVNLAMNLSLYQGSWRLNAKTLLEGYNATLSVDIVNGVPDWTTAVIA